MICAENNFIPSAVVARLPDSQGGTGRHKCVACAYVDGVTMRRQGLTLAMLPQPEVCDHNRRAPLDVLRRLPVRQAGEGRYKCAACSFHAGFEDQEAELANAAANIATEEATHGSDQYGAQMEGREVMRQSRTYERSPVNRAAAV